MFKTRALLVFALVLGFTTCAGLIGGPIRAAESGKSRADDRWVDPSDERLTKDVSLTAKCSKISDVLGDLSRQTGVTLIAGYNKSDWQVRDRRVIVFARDVPASGLMNSIARVTKLKWKKEASGDPVSYRLLMDRKTLSDAEAQRLLDEKYVQERRKATLEGIVATADASPEQLAEMAKSDPVRAAFAGSGMARGFAGLFRNVPGLIDALTMGQPMSLNVGDLSPEAQAALHDLVSGNDELQRRAGNGTVASADISGGVLQINDGPIEGSFLGRLGLNTANGNYPWDLFDPESSYGRTANAITARAMNGDPVDEETAKNEVAKAMEADKASTDPGEPAPDHPDEPGLHGKVTMSARSRTLSDALFALAQSTGTAVVSDSFGKQEARESLAKSGIELKELLEQIAKSFGSNWDKRAATIEFRDRHWYRKLAELIPDDVIEPWRQAANKSGTLSIEELSQIANLTIQQMAMNVSGDDVLANKTLVPTVMVNQDILRVYVVLSSRQRKMLFSKSGLSLADITPSQWPMVQEMIQRRNGALLDDPNQRVVFMGTADKPDKQSRQIKHTITLSAPGTQIHQTVWTILTPEYDPPKKQ